MAEIVAAAATSHILMSPAGAEAPAAAVFDGMLRIGRAIRNARPDVLVITSSDHQFNIGPDQTAFLVACADRRFVPFGDMDIPAYVFQPLQKRGARGHAAMVWVHGGVHGNWPITMFPFVREAVERGYVIIAPEYRGSTGYGEAHHQAIDYGGHEIDDVVSAVDHLKTLPHVDPERVGIMGWSHGGYISLFTVFRDRSAFKAAAAMVPVTNLVFRLSYKGPAYRWEFATQKRLPYRPDGIEFRRSGVDFDCFATDGHVLPRTQMPCCRFRRGVTAGVR